MATDANCLQPPKQQDQILSSPSPRVAMPGMSNMASANFMHGQEMGKTVAEDSRLNYDTKMTLSQTRFYKQDFNQ